MVQKETTVDADFDKGPYLTSLVEEMLEPYNPSPKAVIQVSVAIDEIFSNIVRYSGATSVVVRNQYDESTGMFSMAFIDNGVPYNPLDKKDPDVTLSAEDRQIGGLGIFLVKKTMDDVQYERKGDQNYFTIFKKIK
jgi:anti-sigma regulatory factor (Ser/Thr protein kinase)